jgi:tetratricopeptide (TPR) repeat protein
MRAAIIALTVALGGVSIAQAQTYSPAPVPDTTSAPALRAQAVMRAVTEHFHRGLSAMSAHDWSHANDEFQAVLALHPPEPQGSTAAYDAGIAQANLGQNDDAARDFRTALQRDPAFLAAMSNLVAVDLRRNDVTEARSIANRFVELAPDSARAHYSRGLAALASNDLATARDDFSQLLKADPRYAVAHYDLGITEVRLGRYTAAATEFTAALQLAPTYARASFALGTVLLREGDRTGARAAFDRAAHDAVDDPSLRSLAIELRNAIAVAH